MAYLEVKKETNTETFCRKKFKKNNRICRTEEEAALEIIGIYWNKAKYTVKSEAIIMRFS